MTPKWRLIPITVVPVSSNEFFVDGGDHARLAFHTTEPTRRFAWCSIRGLGRSRIGGSTDGRSKRRREGPRIVPVVIGNVTQQRKSALGVI